MSQHYSDPTRESDKYALPDTEVFYAEDGELDQDDRDGRRLDRQMGREPG